MSALELVLAEVLVLAGLGASVLTWRRAVLELGSSVQPHQAAKIYLVGQLGKYVPGSFWAFLVQMELARKVGVPRSRALTASVVAAGIAVLSGMAVGLLVVPGVADEQRASVRGGRGARRRLRRRPQPAGAHEARERGHAHHAPPTARQAGDVGRHARGDRAGRS